MLKLSDYQSRLHKMVAEHNYKPFKYGTNDCFTFAGRAIEAVTGEDVYSKYLGRYRTVLGGLRLSKKEGFSDQIDYLKSFGEVINPNFARFGDLIIFDSDGQTSVGVCFGSIAVAISENGIIRVPVTAGKEAIRYA